MFTPLHRRMEVLHRDEAPGVVGRVGLFGVGLDVLSDQVIPRAPVEGRGTASADAQRDALLAEAGAGRDATPEIELAYANGGSCTLGGIG
jgi:hypothetical protein